MFAVMGVTGKVGSAVARHLLAAGAPVRAIVRDEAKRTVWAEAGCEVAIATLDDGDSLAAAFDGARGVFAMLPPQFDPEPGFPAARTMIATLRNALATARPERLVALSTVGADATQPNLLNQLGLLEAALSDLPSRTTFVRAAWFMDNAAGDLTDARCGVVRSHLQPTDRSIPMVASDDVGQCAADLLLTADAPTIVELEAVDRVSPDQIAAAFARALGHDVRAEPVARGGWEAEFRTAGMANPLPRMQMIDGFNQGWIDFADRGAHARKAATTIDQVIAAIVART
ncbi:MAG TPA: NmrA family NAD(P)-binding protein [Sphingomonas sp.]